MIVRKEYVKYMRQDFWHIIEYLLFGFIPLYVKKTRVE